MAALPWTQLLAVAMGAAAGAWLRWWTGLRLNGVWLGFPLGTLLVHCVGGLMIGAAMVAFERFPNETLRLLLVTGFLGGLTTFSTFSAEVVELLMNGDWPAGALLASAHLAGSLLLTFAGFATFRWLAA